MHRYIFRHPASFLLVLLSTVAAALAAVYFNQLKGQVLNLAIGSAGQVSQDLAGGLLALLLLMIGVRLLNALESTSRSYFSERCRADLRLELYDCAFRPEAGHYRPSAELLAAYSRDCVLLTMAYFSRGLLLFSHIVLIISGLIALALIHPGMMLLAALLLSGPMLVSHAYDRRLEKSSRASLSANRDFVGYFSGLLKGLEAIKNYAIERPIFKLYAEHLGKFRTAELGKAQTQAESIGAGMLVSLGAQLCLTLYGLWLLYRGSINSGQLLTILGLIQMLNVPLYWLSKLYQAFIEARPAAEKMLTLVAYGRSEAAQKRAFAGQNFDLHCEALNFSHDQSALLQNLNLDLPFGQKILITGPSGCGKSTLIRLLCGFLRADSGRVELGGQALNDLARPDRLITLVSQEAVVFRGSLRENLCLGEPLDDQACLAALKAVGLGRFQDLDLDLAEGGHNLSGGEKRRLSLARGLLRPTPLLILDEPLANIDPSLVEELEALILSLEGRTVIVVSHVFDEAKLAAFDAVYDMQGGQLHAR